MNQTDTLCINTIRMLAVDAIEKAKSGHPGLPMGAADYAFDVAVDGKRWATGIYFSFPFFDGLKTRAKVAQARSDLATTTLAEAQLRDSIAQAMGKRGFSFIEVVSPCPTAHARRAAQRPSAHPAPVEQLPKSPESVCQ